MTHIMERKLIEEIFSEIPEESLTPQEVDDLYLSIQTRSESPQGHSRAFEDEAPFRDDKDLTSHQNWFAEIEEGWV